MSGGGPVVAAPLQMGLRELSAVVPTDVVAPEDIARYRAVASTRAANADAVASKYGLSYAHEGDTLTVFAAARASAPTLRVVFVHGGGLIAGARFDGVDTVARHAQELGLEVWTVEYPLAPEATFTTMVQRVVSAVVAAGADGVPVVLAGQSAGGGIAAAAAMECRDQQIELTGQLLICPMLDARDTASARQYVGDPSWSPVSNRTAWAAALTDSSAVPPGERTDLRGLAPAFLDAGSAEVFRDSITRYASALWAAGVAAELHVWSGGFHGFDGVVEHTTVSRESHRARAEWLRRAVKGEL